MISGIIDNVSFERRLLYLYSAVANMRPKGKSLLLPMFLDVIEAEGEDLEDNLKEDFRPILFFFVCHFVQFFDF